MTISLPDVNVLLALALDRHPHHLAAAGWFASQRPESVAICRLTHMGLLRLLTNARASYDQARSIPEAWNFARMLTGLNSKMIWVPEPPGIDDVWSNLMHLPGVGPSSWTDAYLAAFARASGLTLITFDRGFRRWPDLSLELLHELPAVSA